MYIIIATTYLRERVDSYHSLLMYIVSKDANDLSLLSWSNYGTKSSGILPKDQTVLPAQVIPLKT